MSFKKLPTFTSNGAAAVAVAAAGATPIVSSPKIRFLVDPFSQAFLSALICPPAPSQKFVSLLGAFFQAAASFVPRAAKFNATSAKNALRTGEAATFKIALVPFLSTCPAVRPAAWRAAFNSVLAAVFAAFVGAAFLAALAAFNAAFCCAVAPIPLIEYNAIFLSVACLYGFLKSYCPTTGSSQISFLPGLITTKTCCGCLS